VRAVRSFCVDFSGTEGVPRILALDRTALILFSLTLFNFLSFSFWFLDISVDFYI
jgi:hypothetical protein